MCGGGGGALIRSQLYLKDRGLLKVGETVFPREDPITWISNTKRSALKTFIRVIYRLRRLYLDVFTYMHKKEAINLKRRKGRVWRKKRKRKERKK